jgi:hypothetical protein
MPANDLQPSPGRIVAEVFTDAQGRPVERDSPALAAIEVTVEAPDGQLVRTYATVEAEGPASSP